MKQEKVPTAPTGAEAESKHEALNKEKAAEVTKEETSREKSDLYLLTLEYLAGKVSFEKWIEETKVWARATMQPTHLDQR